MTTNPLDEIQARADAATQGPWVNEAGVNQCMSIAREVSPHNWEREGMIPEEYVRDCDAEFIAHAREDVPKLVRALRSAEAVLDAADKQPGPFKGITSTALVRTAIREALG